MSQKEVGPRTTAAPTRSQEVRDLGRMAPRAITATFNAQLVQHLAPRAPRAEVEQGAPDCREVEHGVVGQYAGKNGENQQQISRHEYPCCTEIAGYGCPARDKYNSQTRGPVGQP